LMVTCDGKEIPYEGPMVKRGDPTREDYIHIGPGEAVSAEVDLSLAYNLSKLEARKCQVEFKGRVYDIVRDGVLLPRRRDEHRGMDVPGNRVDFRLVSR
jgi:hypothetical protein